ncbi:pollen receptor-like kinase 3 [Punica granatum]|uniref:Protein kinase domain-containing protein n=2 Tax=Punica granatum TaxID=22663 RepID=A0A218W156_PUNGR|nr:pollen receptor-like kinase 3 [Punica granatum]OWM66557.1 hypothetical protein CDL15_Pgr013774 [Punica granatum]PKI43788.1 hypothetical protein CRG98_035799 [Punica granatum]
MAVARLLGPLTFLCIILLLITLTPERTDAMSQSDALLKLKRSFTNTNSLDSWSPSSDPCERTWEGIICYNGIVTGLRLGEMNLSGKIDVDALLAIPGLRTISFVNNSFSGPIPEFNRMGTLKAIYLSDNQFSGEIAGDYFAKMGSLKKLWLSENQFTGNIPSSISQLSHLIELHLENNQFSGEIPSIDIPTLTSLNVSNNKLKGEIPPSLSKFDESSFAGNAGLCGGKLGQECPKEAEVPMPPNGNQGSGSNDTSSNNQGTDSGGSHKSSSKIIIAVVIVLVLILIVAIFVILRMQRRGKVEEANFDVLAKESADEPPIQRITSGSNRKEMELPKKGSLSNLSRKGSNSQSRGSVSVDLVLLNRERGNFGMADLMKAAAEVLGNGGLGSSYKAVMSNGLTVVVKRIREMNGKEKDEFDMEMRKLGKLRNPNILAPLAYHYRRDEKLLVCEYVPKGSLLYLLHGDRGPSHAALDWLTRLKIIKGISRGIGVIHNELASSDLPHGNLKSSNVLLGTDNEPLLADYGFKQLLNTSNALQSLFAYKAPEAAQYGMISPKCDVYCLGIIILEILTGKFPSQYLHNGKGGTDVVEWVIAAISEGREAKLFDPEITSSTNCFNEMEKLLHIGAACTETNPELRLDMKEATQRIEEIQIEGNHDVRAIQVFPSLRDGYADSPTRSAELHNPSARREDDSFVFPIS